MTHTTDFARSYYRDAVRSVSAMETHLQYMLSDWRHAHGKDRANQREVIKIRIGSLRSARRHEAWMSDWLNNEATLDRNAVLIDAAKEKIAPLDLAMRSVLQAAERRAAA